MSSNSVWVCVTYGSNCCCDTIMHHAHIFEQDAEECPDGDDWQEVELR